MKKYNKNKGKHPKQKATSAKRCFLKGIKSRLSLLFNYFKNNHLRVWITVAISLVLILTITVFFIIRANIIKQSYSIGKASSLITPINQSMADKIKYDSKKRLYNFDSSKSSSSSESITSNSQHVTAVAYTDPTKGVSVTDPVNKVDFSLKPKFNLFDGKQDGNRIVYPMSNGTGWAIYSMQATGVKEDILLNSSKNDSASYEYTLGIGDGLEARIESDGSIGVYGNAVLSGNVTASTDADSALLLKARQNAKKDTLIFNIPKPTIIETGKKQSSVKASYSLQGNNLKVNVSGLKKANYPLSIDPSIYVVTAQQFMNGNNETNINFNVDNKLIEKGRTTGARIDSWTNTTTLPTSTWGGSSAAAGGYIYSIGGITFSGQIYNTQGSDSFTVPTGVTSITLKMWGGGGGGGAGSATGAGGAGGGAGYVNGTISVTPGETLTVYVGGGGGAGVRNTSGGGGGGGGYSSIYRGSTLLAIVAGGGGGGGARAATIGGGGGAGGGTTGVNGNASGVNNGGGGGTPTTGGAAGTGGTNPGTAGTSLTGGLGGNGRNNNGTNGGAANGGLATGGAGGAVTSTNYGGGGGGGAGYFGGGGGGGSTTATGGSGGGGGSSYTIPAATSVTNTAGSGINPGNSSDTYRNGAGNGGNGGAAAGVGTAGANGLVAITYGSGGTTVSSSVSWAKFNTASGSVDSANPGGGACSGWCTTADYNLPSARSNFSLTAYNGFLYAVGGIDSDGVRQNTVYIAKLGANGEPQLWHPDNTDKNTWVYWYQDTNISSARSDTTMVAYNNRMYLLGGRTASGVVSTVEIADINPTGKLGTWTASTSLPTNLYGHSVQVYNDRLYIIGGSTAVGTAPTNSVYYIKINSNGTLNNWVQTTSFATGRLSGGGNFSVVWGAYIYVSGGCSAVNASGHCTAVQSDSQVASINADGSLDVWNNIGTVSNQRMGFSMVAWRDNIYEIGGCTSQNSTTGDCNASMLDSIIYGKINQDGDASTVDQSVALNTAPCSGASPTGCNLPGTTYTGNMLSPTIITNGYLYIFGGCTNNTCSTTTGNVAYTAISSTGTMTKPATCPYGSYQGGTWCVDTVHTITGGIAAASPVVFNNRIYLIGGLNGSANKNTINRADLNSDGSISAWATTQSMTGLTMTSVSYTFAFARSNPASAGTYPGNLYVLGGCSTSSAAGCTAYSTGVYKCNIQTNGDIAGCTTTGQLQIGVVPGDGNTYTGGLGIMSGTVYANYVYLVGGVTPVQVDLSTIMYAQINSIGNIVPVTSYPADSALTTAIGTGSPTGTGAGWVQSAQQMAVGRRRSSAFGYNGYIYAVGGYEASTGVLADIEFIKVNVSNGSLGSISDGWHVSAVEINQRWGLSVAVSNSFAYVIGGCTTGASPGSCTVRTDVIQTFQIYNNDSGAPVGFNTSANTYSTNPSRIGASSAILNGYIYTAGGCISATDCTGATSNVSYAPIDVNGSIGTWASTTAALPANRTWGKLEASGGTLYYIGGQSDTATDRRSEIYYGTPASGNVTTWGTATNTIPAARTKFGATVWNNRIYIVGGEGTGTGCTASNVCNTVYVSPELDNGGNITSAWSSASTPFNVARSGLTAVSYANNLYIFGGYDGVNYLSDSQYTQINSDTGLAGTWTFSASLPGPLSNSEGFAANGYVYLMGGRSSATVCDPITLVAPISANTTIASGNNPTGIGEWYETNQRFTGSRYGASAVYNDGKAYVLGGGCGATLTYASPVTQQTTLLSQPQVAKYSIMIDTDSDVFPNKWLLNGIDNSIGAKWRLKYRSMTNTTTSCIPTAMTTWGQETVFGDVTLGLPGVYTPKDSSGASTNCARFYYFNVTVDSSQAFGYPDDVSRGPTITDLTMQFTADPSKRLMHGRTFTGGIQQPIDTPYYTQ